MSEENRLVQERIKKLNDLKELGINPYPYSYDVTHKALDVNTKYDSLKEEEKVDDEVCIAGRIMNFRKMGKASFMHVQDQSGKIQIYLRKDDLPEGVYDIVKKFDIGDIIGIKGTIFKTRLGEVTVYAKECDLLTKTLEPLPEKYHGLQDTELRYRMRYLDLVMSSDVRKVFEKRSLMIRLIRDFLAERKFMEVETPLLQTQYGGASARPFVTHINAWNMPMYLSISPELYLKRLVVGGFEKVFTICKNFRNEGVDRSHNPEFTMIELYQAYTDYDGMMKLMEECFEYVALKLNGTTKVDYVMPDGFKVELDFKAPWKRVTLMDSIKEYVGIDVNTMSAAELEDFCISKTIEYENVEWGALVMAIFDELVEPKIIQPTHVYDRPKEATPLCKIHRKDSRLNEQCEPVCVGMELGNMYSELNDPLIQEALLKAQDERGRGGDEEAHPMDKDFINAIRVGLPPTGGIGWGIDRMALILLAQDSVRDVILFPTMKPLVEEAKSSEKNE